MTAQNQRGKLADVTETPTLQHWPAPDGSVGREVLVAIDLGGTKTTVAVTARNGGLLARTTIPTESEAEGGE